MSEVISNPTPAGSQSVLARLFVEMVARSEVFQARTSTMRWQDAIAFVDQEFWEPDRLRKEDAIADELLPRVVVLPGPLSRERQADGWLHPTNTMTLLVVDCLRHESVAESLVDFRNFLGELVDDLSALAGVDRGTDDYTHPPIASIQVSESPSFVTDLSERVIQAEITIVSTP